MRLSQIDKADLATLSDEQVGRIVFGAPQGCGGLVTDCPGLFPNLEQPSCGIAVPPCGVAALLLGGSPRVMDGRIRAAAALFREGAVPLVIPTGGVRHPDEGCGETEAEYMARGLRALGVPDAAVIPENEARTTRENMIFGETVVERACRPRGVFTVYVVTSANHLRRSLALARIYLPRTARVFGRAARGDGGGPGEWTRSRFWRDRVRRELGLVKGLVDHGEMDDIEIPDGNEE